MKNIFLIIFLFYFFKIGIAQSIDSVITIVIIESENKIDASLNESNIPWTNNKKEILISKKLDLNEDFIIEASFEVLKRKSAYGIGFMNARGGNTAGFLINEKGEYYLYLLFDGSSCLLNGKRSFEEWKKNNLLLKKKGNINKLKIEKKENIYSIFINDEKIESFTLPDDFGNYYFTHYGILTEGKNIISKVHSFDLKASTK